MECMVIYLHTKYIIILEDGMSLFFVHFPLTDGVKKTAGLALTLQLAEWPW